MAKKKNLTPTDSSNAPPEFHRELIVVAKPEVNLRIWGNEAAAAAKFKPNSLSTFLKKNKCSMMPLYGLREEKLKDKIAQLPPEFATELSGMVNYYYIQAEDSKLDNLCQQLNKFDLVEAAYITPPTVLASMDSLLKLHTTNTEDPGRLSTTPDFTSRQTYLNPAPGGVDARFAWTFTGGQGLGIQVTDIEAGWNFEHEDLTRNSVGVVIGTSSTNTDLVDHGTAVTGIVSASNNFVGVTGIASDTRIGGAAPSIRLITSGTIRAAADRLNEGDIILIPLELAGPRAGARPKGYIPLEWWRDRYLAIRYAVALGIIVVAAAGNGSENLDDPIYDEPHPNEIFPNDWFNPFNPNNPSSQAILVGAGAPPPGTHGRDHGPDRSRIEFSNFGQRVDCQAYGLEVTTTGIGDLQDSPNLNVRYTDVFGGTSSASPIVAGVLACLQGILRARSQKLLTSQQAIDLLRSTGSPQTDAPNRPRTQRIGNRPDLKQLIANVIDIADPDGWLYNRKLLKTYASTGSKDAWVFIRGDNKWLRIHQDAPDGVGNVLLLLSEAQVNNRFVDVFIRNGKIEGAVLK